MHRASFPALAISAVLGGLLGGGAVWLLQMEARQLAEAERAVLAARLATARGEGAATFASPAPSRRPRPAMADAALRTGTGASPQAGQALDADQALKDLLTLAWNDRRNMREKLDDLLAEHPGQVGVAIASKGVFDLGGNTDVLSDQALQALYLGQEDPAFRRVLAQVASKRGDNRLIELHVAEAGIGLDSGDATTRQQALVALARTRHVAAADLAAPLLRDADTGVVLDALLALRATGNQRHLRQVQALLQHPEEPVRWLARDVAEELRMLSDAARTRVLDRDMEAELPPWPVAQQAIACQAAR